jgi:hypothetical protein
MHGPSYNAPLVVLGDGEHHDATAPTCDLRFGYGRARSHRLHSHAETEKGPLSTAIKRSTCQFARRTKDEARRIATNIAKLPNDAAFVERGMMSAFGGKADIN